MPNRMPKWLNQLTPPNGIPEQFRNWSPPGGIPRKVELAPELMVPAGLQPLMHKADKDPKLQFKAVDAYHFGKKLKKHLRGIYGEMWAEKHPNLIRVLMTSPQWFPMWLTKHRFMHQRADTSEMIDPKLPEDEDEMPLMSEEDSIVEYPSKSTNQTQMIQRRHKSNVEQDDGEEIAQFRLSDREGISKERDDEKHVQEANIRDAEYKRIREEEEAMQESADTLEGLLPDTEELESDKISKVEEPVLEMREETDSHSEQEDLLDPLSEQEDSLDLLSEQEDSLDEDTFA